MNEVSDVMVSVRASQDVAEHRGRLLMAQTVLEWATRHAAMIPDAPFFELIRVINRASQKADDDA